MNNHETITTLNEMFNNLNTLGKETALKRINEMLELPHFICKDEEAEAKSDEFYNSTKCIDRIFDINPADILYMQLVANDNGDPCIRILTNDNFHDYPVTNASEIATVNEFIRSLNPGISVEFNGKYKDYADLISECWELLKVRISSESENDNFIENT